jgi:hypothetical protein
MAMSKKISKRQHDKALTIARQLVSEVPLGELYDSMIATLDDAHTSWIAKAMDPSVIEAEKELKADRKAFMSKLDEATAKDFEMLEDKMSHMYFRREIAGFYLGTVVAAQLGRKEVRRGK